MIRFVTHKRLVADRAYTMLSAMETLLSSLEAGAKSKPDLLFRGNGFTGLHMALHAISLCCEAAIEVVEEDGAITAELAALTVEVGKRLQEFHAAVVDAEEIKREELPLQ